MKGKKSTRSAFLTSLMSLVLCFAMLLGTTLAWFTDTATSGVNRIVAGNLDVEVEYSKDGSIWKNLQDTESLFSENLWEPGHTEFVYLKVKNAGTLGLKYKVMVTPASEKGGVNVEGNSFKLSDYLMFGTTATSTTFTAFADRDAARDAATVSGLTNQARLTKTGMIRAGQAEQYLALVVYMPEGVGNEANYKTGTTAPSIDLGITVVATQLEAEDDSFDKNYDAGAVNDPKYVVGPTYDYFPQVMASAQVAENGADTVITASGKLNSTDATTTDLAKVTVPAAAVAAGATELTVKVVPTAAAEESTSQAGLRAEIENSNRETANFDIKVEGVKSGNDADINVEVFVGKGLANVKVYHNGTLIEGTTYDATTGIVKFTTKTFSDFTVAYDAAVAAIGTKTYGSLANAVAAAKSSDEIILLKDETVEGSIAVKDGKDIVLNLNGHNVVSNDYYVFIVSDAKFHVTGTGSIFENVKDGYAPIVAKGSGTDVADYTVITIDKGVTLKGDYTGIFVAKDAAGGYNNYGLVVNMKGTIDMSAVSDGYHYSGLYVNGQNKVTTGNVMQFNLDGATVTGCESEGIYAAGYAKWNIKNSNIAGASTAIEIRAGELNINGGSYTATTDTSGSDSNGNGSTSYGAAIAVAQHTTKLPIIVKITDGTFTGVNALAEVNPENNSADAVAKISMAVSGGTFNGAIASADVTGFITGGKFSTDPSAYVAAGKEAIPNEDGTWSIADYVPPIKNGENTYETLDAAIAGAQPGDNIEITKRGTYNLSAIYDKKVTIIGTKDTKINATGLNLNGAQSMKSDITFNGVTIDLGNRYTNGFTHANSVTYKNCTIKGIQYLYAPKAEFDNCIFEIEENDYSVRTDFGGENVSFTNCTFNTVGKAILVYADPARAAKPINVTVTGCTFNDSVTGSKGKAAIETGDNTAQGGVSAGIFQISLTLANNTVNGFAVNSSGESTNSTLWANKNSIGHDRLNVLIDGVAVY